MQAVLESLTLGTSMSVAARQLLAYEFPPGSTFEGHLVGALERIESGGGMRILDVLFVGREPDSGELVAVSLSNGGSAGMIGRLISFRLESSARRATTDRTLSGPLGEIVRSLAATLEPGAAIAAVLVEHAWSQTLGEAIERMGGTQRVSEFVETSDAGELWTRLSRLADGVE
jgi:hypothetical protein